MKSNTFQSVYLCLLLVFAGVLSVSGTIALRNVLHVLLLVLLLGYILLKWRWEGQSIAQLVSIVPLPVWLWCTYLLVFPLVAPDSVGALANLLGNGMWGESVLTWILAWGAFGVLGAVRLSLWRLALVSAVPVYIHLFLTMLAWAGVLQPAFYEDPSLQQAVQSVWTALTDSSQVRGAFQVFPMGFRGIEPMHGNLGYPASQTMCLGLAVMFAAWHRTDHWSMAKSGLLVVLCFVSVVIAQSRAATYFGLLILVLSFMAYGIYQRNCRQQAMGAQSSIARSAGVLMLSIGLVCLVFFWKVASQNQVWYSMWDKMAIGFQIESPKDLLCDGFTPTTHDFVRQKYPGKDSAYTDALTDGLRGDGGRVLLARVGAELSVSHPWGWNGGRDAYEYRIEQLCGHEPAMKFSHAHNAWVNLILSLGWMAAILYAWVFCSFSKMGWNTLNNGHEWPSALALLLLSIFWLLRGMVDAVYQEHYLQMQAFYPLLLVLRIRSGKPTRK